MEFTTQWFDRLPSTNTFLKECLDRDPYLPSGTVIVAREQTQGQGRRNRCWLSAGHENLTFSFFLRTMCRPSKRPSVTMAAAVAISEMLAEEGLEVELKWPNDVQIDGKKVSGILSEGIAGGILIGIGLNINMENTAPIDQPATSLWIETGMRRRPDELLETLLKHLSHWIEKWEQGGFSSIRKNWEAKIPQLASPERCRNGKNITVRDGNTERTGELVGFGENGELLLRIESGEVLPVWAGDLYS